MMTRQHVYRYEVADRETLDRIASDPPPAGFTADGSAAEYFRDIFYDTAAADLDARGVSVRLRLHDDGSALLAVNVTDREPAGDGAVQHTREAEVTGTDPASLFQGDTEAANLLRSLVDPARLEPVFELEVVRRTRTLRPTEPASSGADDPRDVGVRLSLDVVTLRTGELSADMVEAEVAADDAGNDVARKLAGELKERYDLRQVLAERATRARELFQDLDVVALKKELRGAREVAVVVHERGALAMLERKGRLILPWAPGSGGGACRRALRRAFGHGRARIRLLGVRGDMPGRPAVEVWLAEDLEPTEDTANITWIPTRRALRIAGGPGLRDARTLAALQVVARSSFVSWAPPAAGAAVLPGRRGRTEPFELVLQRLEAGDPTWEPPASDVPPNLLLNMELSRLSFDEHVLAMAEDRSVPLLERLRFLAMFGERRDDFFMSRVAHFKRMLARGDNSTSIDGMTPAEILDAVATRARHMTQAAYELLNRQLLPALQRHGIRVERWEALSAADRAAVRDRYGERIEALLMPFAADAAHPFPHVRNLRPALAVVVRPPDGDEQLIALELPGELPRFVPLPDGRRFVLLEDVIQSVLPELYPGVQLVQAHSFRVTRSAHMDLGGEPLDMLQAVEEEVSRRPFQEVIRLEVEHAMPPHIRHHLLREFQYEAEDQLSTPGEQDIYTVGRLVDLASLKELAGIDMPELHYGPLEQQSPLDEGRTVFEQVREQDRLFHFPHDDFQRTVERFLHEAADDPDVVSLRATLYRTSSDSGVVAALRRARENGKDVAVLVELKASFDEKRNIEWARGLEKEGIRVAFSPVRFKVHAKIALVVRREGERMRRYAYIGTGNLNAATARTYVDLGLLTADKVLSREVGSVFNLLTGYSVSGSISRLLVAPFDMRRRLLRLIDREAAHARAGRPARIRVQINGLADRRVIGALYRASAAGVRIEMMVREICALRPGVPGVSDNITVVSVVGRLLQHARIFHFANGGDDEYYIASADWRPRNLSERVEVGTPITAPEHQAMLDRVLEETLNEPSAWRLGPDGTYSRSPAAALQASGGDKRAG
ncbi:MAG TPA: polyphosphate kinase 1 [Longimicrobiales bacterium]|nr:polyphosphate kinase 1 [Longimicrobiales bacterium]